MQPNQADNEFKEEHLLSFVVNALDDELPLNLGENVEITPDELYEVLVVASTNRTPINHNCETTNDSPHANIVRGHFTEQFELDAVDRSATRSSSETCSTCSRIDLHLDPYYGGKAETEGMYFSEAKAGTTAFHAYDAFSHASGTNATRWRSAGWKSARSPATFSRCS